MSRYYTPSGADIDEVGVDPDIEAAEPELTEGEQESYRLLREQSRIRSFVEATREPSPAEISAFIADLRNEGIELSDRYLRRLIRIEVNRVLNRSEVFDLDFDVVLQRAVEYLRQ